MVGNRRSRRSRRRVEDRTQKISRIRRDLQERGRQKRGKEDLVKLVSSGKAPMTPTLHSVTLMEMKLARHSMAMALASRVLPQPGGPAQKDRTGCKIIKVLKP